MFRQLEPLPEVEQQQLNALRSCLKSLNQVCVAYSGGVDSTLIATIAREQLESHAFAVTGVSPALAPYLLEEARKQADWIGIRHQECITKELQDPAYSSNPVNRCFACKKELHSHLKDIAKAAKGSQVVDGVNHDDLNEHRPGIAAAIQAGVRSPLAELKIGKSAVRQISKSLGLPWWDKPSQPCLSSRFPYGESITNKRLIQVSKAEEWLIENGFKEVRVRIQGLSARIELPENQIKEIISNELRRRQIVTHFLDIGFTSVSLDLEGLVSGKLNRRENVKQSQRKNKPK